MKVKIILAKNRLAWYHNPSQIGNEFSVNPHVDELSKPGECFQVTEGDWKGYLIDSKDTELTALTRQEATERGYTLCGKPDTEWQSPREINDLEDDELELDWVLFDIGSDCLTIDPDDVKTSVLDLVAGAEFDIGCDTSMGIEALEGFDWSELYKAVGNVNNALSSASYYTLTKIQLLP